MSVDNEWSDKQDDDSRVSVEVVLALAAAEDVDPVELEPPLYAVIDLEALDDLFRDVRPNGPGNVEVTFEYFGREVSVWGQGDVTVSEHLDDSSPRSDHDRGGIRDSES